MGALLMAGTMAFAGTTGWAAGPVESMPPAAPGTSVVVDSADPAHGGNGVVEETVDTDGGHAGWHGRVGRFMPSGAHARNLACQLTPSGDCARRLWDWLTYCPQSCRSSCSTCTRTCAPTCQPPLYTYFMWYGGSNCGGACCAPSSGVAAVEEQPAAP